ncbi:ABC transporter ATP-binding protein [Psychrobacter glacincola]|uniref:ABC transporter ATP-binding protein n=1 Tax=Psychrobacter glacincola TaxID=56810 RepID=A0ABW1WC38_9GAMM|nr:ABC transporter ATP-binding protein [Psychrobacter glacincola]
MFNMIKQLFSLLSDQQIKSFYKLQILVIVMAFTEILGIASIAPFMALVGDITILERGGIFTKLYQASGLSNPIDFLFYAGLGVLAALAVSTIVSMYTTWKLALYGSSVGTEIADRLYTYYMHQDWQFHASGSSAQLTKQVSSEAMRITSGIVQPVMRMNAKVVLAIFISVGLLIYNPLVALGGLVVFILAYFLLYQLVRKTLVRNGYKLSQVATTRFRLMNEGFGGIKDVLLLDRSYDFVKRFENSGKVFARAQSVNMSLTQVPRYFMELIAFGTMIGLVLMLVKLHQGNLGAVLPILAVYALAAFKLLPALQQIYGSIAQIKGSSAAFESIKNDLLQSSNNKIFKTEAVSAQIKLEKSIILKDIKFNYPNKSRPAVDGVTMTIPANGVVGLVGSSGSGKSTLIDLLLGLLVPQQGKLCIDDICITEDNKRAWQNTLGFVPQSIFLSEGSIAENIAFGLPAAEIDIQQVNKAIELAHLTELMKQLPEGMNTKVGERGVQLSGGQRQRIGIARALYHEADVLVFDEATSALDGITEKIVMDAIHEFSGKKTIIMIAHRLKTVQKCDIIYFMAQGKIIDSGTYEHLVENNPEFKKMADHA